MWLVLWDSEPMIDAIAPIRPIRGDSRWRVGRGRGR